MAKSTGGSWDRQAQGPGGHRKTATAVQKWAEGGVHSWMSVHQREKTFGNAILSRRFSSGDWRQSSFRYQGRKVDRYSCPVPAFQPWELFTRFRNCSQPQRHGLGFAFLLFERKAHFHLLRSLSCSARVPYLTSKTAFLPYLKRALPLHSQVSISFCTTGGERDNYA